MTTTPEPITRATVKVGTTELRQALKSVHAHHKKTRKGADQSMHRVRLILANGTMFVGACNDESTALAKLAYVEDSRGTMWAITDAPLVVDLQPRHIPLITAWVSKQAAGPDSDPLVSITADVQAGEIELEDVGGLFSSGERQVYQFDPPNDAMPDLIDITGKALDQISGAGERHKDLIQHGDIVARFAMASKQYGQQLRIRATGSADSGGFVVQCGPSFFGTVASKPGGDDGLKSRERIDQDWRRVLGAKLSAVG
jgi:hypothetical protein